MAFLYFPGFLIDFLYHFARHIYLFEAISSYLGIRDVVIMLSLSSLLFLVHNRFIILIGHIYIYFGLLFYRLGNFMYQSFLIIFRVLTSYWPFYLQYVAFCWFSMTTQKLLLYWGLVIGGFIYWSISSEPQYHNDTFFRKELLHNTKYYLNIFENKNKFHKGLSFYYFKLSVYNCI